MFESNDKGLNSLMWNRFNSLCWNVCSAVGCHLGAGWTGLKLLCCECTSTRKVDVQSTPGCVQRSRMFRGTEARGLLWSCMKESCGRGVEGLSWPESSWFFPSREIGAGCEGREGRGSSACHWNRALHKKWQRLSLLGFASLIFTRPF